VAQLRRERAEFDKRDANVYAITTGTPADSAAFCRDLDIPFTCLVDKPGEPAYRAFGLEKVGMARLFGPSALRSLVTLAKRFREVSIPKSGDVYQMSGTFVLDGDTRVRLAHRDRYPNDHVPNEDVWRCLDEIRAATARG
jgi:peroxiredoxin